MEMIRDFFENSGLSQEEKLPDYYHTMLIWTYRILMAYFMICSVVSFRLDTEMMYMSAVWCAITVAMQFLLGRMSIRLNLLAYTALIFFWCYNYIRQYGWGSGGQHFLLPLIIIIFFSVYETGLIKLLYWLVLITFRLLMYSYTLNFQPAVELSSSVQIFLQVINTLVLFVHLALICIILSSSIQATEKSLLINNQMLKKQAGTDALTGLANRRVLRERMELFRKEERDSPFCVAIADIDFFKKVNDTYGHICGDLLLKELAALFIKECEGNAYVCRWGGEEFCFFIPYVNLDEAGVIMENIRRKVENMELSYEGNVIRVTITIGLVDYDFRSELEKILDAADEKLYMGKEDGRNRLVM